jgi:hypothetical protein
LVARPEFPLALNWSSSTFQFSAVAGPAVGGALIALTQHAAVVYVFTAVSSLICLGMICLVRAHSKPPPKEPISMETLLGGFRFVFNHRIILGAITLDLFAVLFGGATALLPVYAKDILRRRAARIGPAASRLAGRLDAVRHDHGAPGADAKGRAIPHLGGRDFRAGHGRFWLFEVVLVVVADAFYLRFRR